MLYSPEGKPIRTCKTHPTADTVPVCAECYRSLFVREAKAREVFKKTRAAYLKLLEKYECLINKKKAKDDAPA